MEEAYKELEDLRSELETLKEEYRAKSELSESLRRAHGEQLAILQEAKVEIERQAQEINAKVEEISLAKQVQEELKSSLLQKESALKNLGLVNENLKTSLKEQLTDLERKNRDLVSALDESNAKRGDQERVMGAKTEEIDKLKGLLSMSQKRCSDAEQRAQAPKEVRRRDEMLLKLEEEKGAVENQLKWKTEQFRHLEEAHSKLQDEFRTGKKEWALERSNLVDEFHTVQMNLDSQARLAEALRSQLKMCNQALAHEESRRKLLEVQMSESKTMYDGIVSEYEKARCTVAALSAKRDEEIASLRNSLAMKATLLKDLEVRGTHLGQENEELRKSLKEYQEAQINGVDATASLKAFRQRFRALEQAHRDCPGRLKTREAEWMSHSEKLAKDLDKCLSQLSSKETQLLGLQAELEGGYSLLEQQKMENEETLVVLMVVNSKYLECSSNLENLKLEMEQCRAKAEERIADMVKQLEKKNNDLIQAQAETLHGHEVVDTLQGRLQYLESVEQKYTAMQLGLDTYKSMLEESSKNLYHFKEQASKKEICLQEDLRKVLDALDLANIAVAEKTSELNKVKFELQQQKSVTEQMEKLKSELELELNSYNDENQAVKRELEVTLLAKMDAEKALMEGKVNFYQLAGEKNRKIEELQQHILLLEEENARQKFEVSSQTKLQAETFTEKGKKFLEIAEDMDRKIKGLQTEFDLLEHKYLSRESEIYATLKQEKTKCLNAIEEKESVIADAQHHVLSLEQHFIQSVEAAVALELADKRLEVQKLYKALEEMVAVHIIEEQEIEFKNLLISDLDKDISIQQEKLNVEGGLSSELEKHTELLKAELEMERLEKEKEKVQISNQLNCLQSDKKTSEDQLGELKANIKALHDIIAQFSLEREDLVGQMMGLSDLIGMIYHTDEELTKNWERVMHKVTQEDTVINFERGHWLNSSKMDVPSKNKAGQNGGRRSPLKEHNC